MTRPEACGHCGSPNVEDHCQGLPADNCPWVRCRSCLWWTDHAGRTIAPAAKKDAA